MRKVILAGFLIVVALIMYFSTRPLDKGDIYFDAKHDLIMLQNKIRIYHQKCGHFPSESDGIQSLLESRAPTCFRDEALKEIPLNNIRGYDYKLVGDSFELSLIK